MAHPIAVQYIKKTRLDGFSDTQIRAELGRAGWPMLEIVNSFAELDKSKPTILDVKKELSAHIPELELASPKTSAQVSNEIPPRFISRENVLEETVREHNLPIIKKNTLSPAVVPQRKSFAFVATLIALVLIVGAGGGGFWYWRTNIVPVRAMTTAIEKFKSMKSWRYEAEFIMTQKGSTGNLTRRAAPFLPPLANVLLHAYSERDIGADSLSDGVNAFKIRARGASNLKDAQSPAHELILTLGTRNIPMINENIEMALKVVGGVYYFQFTQLPPFDSSTLIGYGFPRFTENSLVGKWASLDPVAFASDYNAYLTQLANIDPQYSTLRIGADGPTDLITQNEQEQIQKLWEDSSLISWDKTVFSEDLLGVPAYRARGIISRTQLNRFFESASSITNGSNAQTDTQEITALLETLGDIELNLWVAKADERIIKTTAHVAIDTPDTVSDGIVELLLTVDFTDADKDFAIEKPKDAHDLKNTLSGLFADSAGVQALSTESRDARRVRDLALIQRHLETFRERNDKYPKTLLELVPEYMAEMPSDPKSQKPYRYTLKVKNSYTLSAELENRQHPILLRDANPKNATYDVTPEEL